MKLTCPACNARYSINAERLEGRTVKIRCKRCGEAFRVGPTPDGGAVSDPAPRVDSAPKTAMVRPAEDRRAGGADLFAGLASAGADESVVTSASDGNAHSAITARPAGEAQGLAVHDVARAEGRPSAFEHASNTTPFTGERNESSVLFSLATLTNPRPPAPDRTVTFTESSSLIDLRALSAMAGDDAPSSRANDIMHLAGGGAFARDFASPLAAPVLAVEAEESEVPRSRKNFLMVGAVAFAVIAILGIGSVAGIRALSSAPRATGANSAPATTAAPDVASETATPVTGAVARGEPATPSPASAPPPASPSTPAPPSVIVATSATTRASTRAASDGRPIASGVSPVATATAPLKCCLGESETVCQMRLSVGAACGEDRSNSSSTAAAPFDRPSAARAMAISVAGCKRVDSPTGAGHVRVTFQPSGSVSAVDVEAPFAGTPTGACIAQRYRSVRVPAFSGGALAVGKGFALE